MQGLGEMMPEQLWNTTLDPTKRTLRRLTVEVCAAALVCLLAAATPAGEDSTPAHS